MDEGGAEVFLGLVGRGGRSGRVETLPGERGNGVWCWEYRSFVGLFAREGDVISRNGQQQARWKGSMQGYM